MQWDGRVCVVSVMGWMCLCSECNGMDVFVFGVQWNRRVCVVRIMGWMCLCCECDGMDMFVL